MGKCAVPLVTVSFLCPIRHRCNQIHTLALLFLSVSSVVFFFPPALGLWLLAKRIILGYSTFISNMDILDHGADGCCVAFRGALVAFE